MPVEFFGAFTELFISNVSINTTCCNLRRYKIKDSNSTFIILFVLCSNFYWNERLKRWKWYKRYEYCRINMIRVIQIRVLGKHWSTKREVLSWENHVFTMMEGEIKLADTIRHCFPHDSMNRLSKSSGTGRPCWKENLRERVVFQVGRRGGCTMSESRLSRWLLLLPPLCSN